ncbi:MAG: 50S ribosomal protein L4 [Holosporales bacterium]|jgi:large subunit ribosomal protein L4|nr:50S ribosomal protein L4 [Holosporales bacterium]
MKFEILDHKNKVSGELELSDSVFGVLPRRDILARVVLWQLAKRRSGNHAVKGKSEVHGTTRKFVRQKGSGGARHGSRKAVQFRGGGIIFGPVLRDHGFSLQKKIRKLGLRMALSEKAKNGNLLVVDSLSFPERVKTKNFLARFGGEGSMLFVDVDSNSSVLSAMSNIVGYDFLPQIGVNVYDIVRKEKIIVSVDAIKSLESRLLV